MQDEPTPIELIEAVAVFLREEAAPALTGATAFKLRVACNALDLVARQLALQSPAEAHEHDRLAALLGGTASLADLNRALAEAIGRGDVTLATPGVAAHLWQTTLDKLAVDQPGYASYRREAEPPENG